MCEEEQQQIEDSCRRVLEAWKRNGAPQLLTINGVEYKKVADERFEWRETAAHEDDKSSPSCVEFKCGEWSASCRFDGCVNLNGFPEEDERENDYIHICDITEMIDMLSALRVEMQCLDFPTNKKRG